MFGKLFTNMFLFLMVFVVVFLGADWYYYNKVIQREPPNKGQISYSDFRVLWYASYNLYGYLRKTLVLFCFRIYDFFSVWFRKKPLFVAGKNLDTRNGHGKG
ncbi:MAG: hypothetical protein A2Z72_05890 [Omnitrophica bacterium RBG_13_46_9]|nr:MAG: hypothetical protein A2Z72_05890 [Omnitrophica bacterium RBG_13_46_9]